MESKVEVAADGATHWLRATCLISVGQRIHVEAPRFFTPRRDHVDEEDGTDLDVLGLAYQAYQADWRDASLYADTLEDANFSREKVQRRFPDFGAAATEEAWKRLQHIHAVMTTNNLTCCRKPTPEDTLGCGFYPTLSYANHACCSPNAVQRLANETTRAMELVAIRRIKKGEEVTIAYSVFPKGTPVSVRRACLQETFGFECLCPLCLFEIKAGTEDVQRAFPGARLCAVGDEAYQGPKCLNCGAVRDLKCCKRCHNAWYCDEICQRAHWRTDSLFGPSHKSVCTPK